MMAIGNNLARAFALVGALSNIRFRTVIKDTKDAVYIFIGLAAGMSAGTSSYFLSIAGITFFQNCFNRLAKICQVCNISEPSFLIYCLS